MPPSSFSHIPTYSPLRPCQHPFPFQCAEADLLRISNKVRFILAVVGGQLKLSNRRKAAVESELEDEGYDKLPGQKKAAAQVGASSWAVCIGQCGSTPCLCVALISYG